MTEVSPLTTTTSTTTTTTTIIFIYYFYCILFGSMCVMQSFGFNHTTTTTTNMTSTVYSTATSGTNSTTMAPTAHSLDTAASSVGTIVDSRSSSSSSRTNATIPSLSWTSSISSNRSESRRSTTSNSILSPSGNSNNMTSLSTRKTTTPFSSSGSSRSTQVPDDRMVQVTTLLVSNRTAATSLPSPPSTSTSTLAVAAVGAAQISSTANSNTTHAAPPWSSSSSAPSTSSYSTISTSWPTPLLNSTTTSSSTDLDAALFVRVHDSTSYVASLRHHHHNVNTWGPHFEDSVPFNITVTEGEDVQLDCCVGLLGDKLVSWVRRKSNQLDLLTFGTTNHSSDNRIFSDFKYPNNWRLTIRNTTGNDSGVYLCQISTHPPKVLEVQLTVQAPRVFIVNSRGERINEVHYKEGSTLQLICTVNNIMSKTMNWFRNKDLLNQDVIRGGVSIKTDMTSLDQAKSILRVASVTRKDGGSYLCSAPPQNASVTVHILIGENPAELYRNPAASSLLMPVTLLQWQWIWALQVVLLVLWRTSWIPIPAVR